jgi:hypothetical protein
VPGAPGAWLGGVSRFAATRHNGGRILVDHDILEDEHDGPAKSTVGRKRLFGE